MCIDIECIHRQATEGAHRLRDGCIHLKSASTQKKWYSLFQIALPNTIPPAWSKSSEAWSYWKFGLTSADDVVVNAIDNDSTVASDVTEQESGQLSFSDYSGFDSFIALPEVDDGMLWTYPEYTFGGDVNAMWTDDSRAIQPDGEAQLANSTPQEVDRLPLEVQELRAQVHDQRNHIQRLERRLDDFMRRVESRQQ